MPAPIYTANSRKSLPSRGRPCLLTKECESKLLNAIESGMPLKHAAMLAGVSYETFNRWRIKGESKEAPYAFRHFCQSLRRSQAIAMQLLLSKVQEAGKCDWRAAAWLLERRHGDEFAKPQRIEHSGPRGMPITTLSMQAEDARNYLSDDSLKLLVRGIISEEEADA